MDDDVTIKISKGMKEIINEILEKANKEAPDLELNYTDFFDYVQDCFYEEEEISFEGLMNYYGYEAYVNTETKEVTYHKDDEEYCEELERKYDGDIDAAVEDYHAR